MVLLLGMGLCEAWIRRGGVPENVPGARFPADLARPQAGESTFPHPSGWVLCLVWAFVKRGFEAERE